MAPGILNKELPLPEATGTIPSNGYAFAPSPATDQQDRVFEKTVQTIQAEPGALYQLWKQVEQFPRWQEYVISVTATSPTTTHWVIGDPEDPKGKRLEFDSQTTQDVPGEKIAWNSLDKEVDLSGEVTFAPHPTGRGTIVTLTQAVKVPLGTLGNALAAMVKRSPRQLVTENLRHFKQLAEAGEIPSVVGQPHGPRGVKGDIKKWFYGETNPTPPGTSVQD